MLRRYRRTPKVLLAGACAIAAVGLAAAPASAVESALYRGTVKPSNVDGRGREVSDGKQYVLDLRVSLPGDLNTNVGTTTYRTTAGVTACRGTVRLTDLDSSKAGQRPDGRYGSAILIESRRSPSTRKLPRDKRLAIVRARKWCRKGPASIGQPAFGLGYAFPLDPPAEVVELVPLRIGFQHRNDENTAYRLKRIP